MDNMLDAVISSTLSPPYPSILPHPEEVASRPPCHLQPLNPVHQTVYYSHTHTHSKPARVGVILWMCSTSFYPDEREEFLLIGNFSSPLFPVSHSLTLFYPSSPLSAHISTHISPPPHICFLLISPLSLPHIFCLLFSVWMKWVHCFHFLLYSCWQWRSASQTGIFQQLLFG